MPIKLTYHTAKFGGYSYSGTGEIMTVVGHVTLQDHVIKPLNDFMARSPSKYFTNPPSLVAVGTGRILSPLPPFCWGKTNFLKTAPWGYDYFCSQSGGKLHFGGSICLWGLVIFPQYSCFCDAVVFC